MKVQSINCVYVNSYNKKMKSNPQFGISFWKTVGATTGAGAATGAATGAYAGAVGDAATLGTSLGACAATGAAIGSAVGAVQGFAAGVTTYICLAREEKREKKIQKKKEEQEKREEEIRRIQRQQEQLFEERCRIADAEHKAQIDKIIKEKEEQQHKLAIIGKFETKEIQEESGIGLGKIAGYENDKQFINQYFISPYKLSFEDTRYDRDIPNGILLYGLTGNGKTTLANGIIDELRKTTKTKVYDLSSLTTSKLPDTIAEIKELASKDFDENHIRTLIFIDEFDRFALSEDNNSYNAQVNGCLKNFLNNCAQYGITLIATTNYPQNIEKPFITNEKRFPLKTLIEPPSKEDITKILGYYIADDLTTGEIDLDYAAELIENKAKLRNAKYSCSAIEELSKEIRKKAKKEARLVTQHDIVSAVEESGPDLPKKYLDKFKDDFEYIANISYDEYREQLHNEEK